MVKTLSAVYEDGVLKPSEPLALSEHQRVSVTVSDEAADPAGIAAHSTLRNSRTSH
jgi:predicted DNA-binding antitoxin AbrB/MazE fold protein